MYQFAIIGCNAAARQHATTIPRWGNLVAVYDADVAQAQAFADQLKAQAYNNVDALLQSEAIQVVVVCSPIHLHAEHCIKALQARKHVICQQPLCLTIVAAWQMRDTAHFFRKKLVVMDPMSNNEAAAAVKMLLQKNALGAIYSFSITGYFDVMDNEEKDSRHAVPVGLLHTHFSNVLYLLQWLMGGMDISKSITSDIAKQEESFIAAVKMKGGATGTLRFTKNNHAASNENVFEITGALGTIQLRGQNFNELVYLSAISSEVPLVKEPNGEPNQNKYDHAYQQLITAIEDPLSSSEVLANSIATVSMIEQLYHVAADNV